MQNNNLDHTTEEDVFIEKDIVNHKTGEIVFKAGQYVPRDVYDKKFFEIYREEIEEFLASRGEYIIDESIKSHANRI